MDANTLATLAHWLVPQVHKQWHPLMVHFPIALFTAEAIFSVNRIRTKATMPNPRMWLGIAIAIVLLTVITGIHDADFGSGTTLGDVADPLTAHVFFIIAFATIAAVRALMYRNCGRVVFAIATALNYWLLIAAAQAGGSMSHQ
jgi:uncharacterized membrane protein